MSADFGKRMPSRTLLKLRMQVLISLKTHMYECQQCAVLCFLRTLSSDVPIFHPRKVSNGES